jgi:hypothetical protein
MWSSLVRTKIAQGIRDSNNRTAPAVHIPSVESASISTISNRTYVLQAHPRPIPEIAINQAMDDVLADIRLRRRHRATKFKRNVERQSSSLSQVKAVAKEASTSSDADFSDAPTSVS